MKQKIYLLAIICVFPFLLIAQSGKKFILLEEFSTAPCGFCPDGDIIAAQLVKDYPNIIWVTHHAGFGTDSMTVPESIPIAKAYTNGAPKACIDRMDVPIPVYTTPPWIAISRQKWDSVCTAHLNDDEIVKVSITNTYNSATRILDCKIDAQFTSSPDPGDIRINLFIVEDSVVGFGKGYDQTNYYNNTSSHPLYGKGNPIIGYVHHRVLRKVPSGTWGLAGIIPSSAVNGETYSYTFKDISISPLWKADDMDVIAFISYYNSDAKKRRVINSNHKLLKDGSTSGIIATHPNNKMIKLYPNPAKDFVYFSSSYSETEYYSLRIFTIHGQLLKQIDIDAKSSIHEISVNELENGLYFYSVCDDQGEISKGKLVIQK